jgi:RNA 3'-terminal phosphate cyclase (ATP)
MAPGTLTDISIDGSMGEGGGQILRSSLALAIRQGKSFRISNIRAARKRPGLQPQHLAAVKAATSISDAHVEGAEKDSLELVFVPSKVLAGEYSFSIGTAGSTSLVLQTILPALVLADAPSRLILEGGTHNPFAPPFDFLKYAFLPLLNQMGPTVTASLERPGFAPKGGGRVCFDIKPVKKLKPVELTERGKLLEQRAEVLLAHLPQHIAQRELAVIKQKLAIDDNNLLFNFANTAYGAGNVVSIILKSENITECFTAFGQRGIPAEQVAENVVKQVRRYLLAGVPVGSHLADQLLLPLALTGSGRFITMKPSSHTLTNMKVINAFMDIQVQTEEIGPDIWQVCLS